jgi:transposase
MEVEHDEQEIIQRVAALDIGKAEVVCCVRVPGPGRRRMQEIRTFNTMTRSLLAMSDWLRSLGVTRVIMEATSDSAIAVTVLPAGGLLRDLAGQRR